MKRYLSAMLSLITLTTLSACGREANPTITLEVGSLSASHKVIDFFIPSAYAAASNAKLCFKRLRFKSEDLDSSNGSSSQGDTEDNIDLQLGEVEIYPGAPLGEVTIPAGTYRRIEFDLDRNCPSGSSVSFQNSSGNFSTQDTITIKFEGTFEASSSGQKVSLGMGAILSALDSVTNAGQIKNSLEAAGVKGRF